MMKFSPLKKCKAAGQLAGYRGLMFAQLKPEVAKN